MKVEQITYPPLDVPKLVTDSIWIVDSGPIKAMGVIPLPIRMTVIRLQDGSLILHSPIHYDHALRRSLEKYGAIAHLVAPNSAHWMFVKQWQEQCPSVETWGAPGLSKRWAVKRAGIRLDHELNSEVVRRREGRAYARVRYVRARIRAAEAGRTLRPLAAASTRSMSICSSSRASTSSSSITSSGSPPIVSTSSPIS